jgi:GNAT superfamily N-acetyltransferase
MELMRPALLTQAHQVQGFHSGVASLDEWLRKRALANQQAKASRVFVTCDADGAVLGYYALASGAIVAQSAVGKVKRNMPDPIPVVLLGRLAVDVSLQGRGIGRLLFQDAALRVLNAANSVGIRALVVHAISPEAKEFYLKLGLVESPTDPMMLMTTLADLQYAIAENL